jgi:hypothetical protein
MIDKVKIWQHAKKGIYSVINKLRSRSQNSKTGDMSGLYVLPLEQTPTNSIKTKTDHAQCGTCPLKGTICYVNPVSTNSVYNSSHALPVTIPAATDKPLRFGVYGEPGFLPHGLCDRLIGRFTGWTGYTHAWQTITPNHADFLMASIEDISAAQQNITGLQLAKQAWDMGYRTYRIVQSLNDLHASERPCPHYTHGVTCNNCLLCSGKKGRGKINVAAIIHGPQNKIKTYNKGVIA